MTIPLTFLAFGLAFVLSLLIGFVAAYKADRWYGAALSAFSQLFVAIPAFWVGILLISIFSLRLRVLPAGGFPREGWSDPGDALTHLALPVLTIALVMAGSLSRYVRSATLDVMGSDYLRNARAMGSTMGMAMLHHGLRNGAVPVISILGIELATAFLGAVVIEAVFALPGLGSMLLKAIAQHDYPNIQGILFVSTLLVLIVGFVADVAQRLVDPRLRHRARVVVSTPDPAGGVGRCRPAPARRRSTRGPAGAAPSSSSRACSLSGRSSSSHSCRWCGCRTTRATRPAAAWRARG